MGMVFQKPNLSHVHYDNIAYGPRHPRHPSQKPSWTTLLRNHRGAALWDEVKDRLKKVGQGLSGGQQQRLYRARAGCGAGGVLMDEPTSALDPTSTKRI